MLKRISAAVLILLLCSCGAPPPPPPAPPPVPPPTPAHSPPADSAAELRKAVESDPELKRLLTRAIEEGRRLNPDPQTNPAQTLEHYYDFVRFAQRALPGSLIKSAPGATLYQRIDQSLGYLYFISDIPLDELKGRGYFNNSLQYLDSYNTWLRGFVKSWGQFLDQPESWNEETLRLAQADVVFGLNKGWYESPANWKTFNQFFARRLASPDKRPIAAPADDSVFTSPVDAVPMGVWSVGADLKLAAPTGVPVKTATVESVEALLDGSPYAKAFAGGTFTHLFLDVGDYHRYHFPMSGTIWEIRVIPGRELSGGFTTW
ncbi:MAG TPA: phosphatidylserine decarboxylase, partial [Steroidobacteraceae bacterium]|nr:phosphatidylserine decarboxylase [Steroidobacteraceae bacterium]